MENKIPAVRCAGALFAFPDNCGAPYCEGQALKVKVQPSIEPSDGRGKRWACCQPIEPARALDRQSHRRCMMPHMADGILLCSC